jgi:hypothetical protein
VRLGHAVDLQHFTYHRKHYSVETPVVGEAPPTQRVVSFISVVGCGTDPSTPIRQNRRQVIESATSWRSDS